MRVAAPDTLQLWTEAQAQEYIGSGCIFVTPDVEKPLPGSILGRWTGLNKASMSRLLDVDFPQCAQCKELLSLAYLTLTHCDRPQLAPSC